jgi:hypothetical protein
MPCGLRACWVKSENPRCYTRSRLADRDHRISTPPHSLSRGFIDVKTDLELVEDRVGKALGHDVRILQVSWHMNNMKLAERHQFTNEMYVDLNMFCPSMINRVAGEVDSRHIVTVPRSRSSRVGA